MKIKQFPYLIKHYNIKLHGQAEVQLYVFLTSALDGGECSASCPSCFTAWNESLVLTE
jgi:hypothetical protein